MGDEPNPLVIQRTQQKLGKFIQRPQLTDKLLKRPPFRFLHDIVTTAIRQYGVLEGTFAAGELVSDSIKEKDEKVTFLQKLITTLNSELNIVLKAKPSKIVAGAEADKTNELLQALGSLIEKKQTKQKPQIPVSGPQTNGSIANTPIKQSKTSINGPQKQTQPSKKQAQEDLKKGNPPSRPTVRNEPAGKQLATKENGASNTRKPQQKSIQPDGNLGRASNQIDDDTLHEGSKNKLKNALNQDNSVLAKPSKVPIQKLSTKSVTNGKVQNNDSFEIANVPPEDPNINPESDPKINRGEESKEQPLHLTNGTRKITREHLLNKPQNSLRPSQPKTNFPDQGTTELNKKSPSYPSAEDGEPVRLTKEDSNNLLSSDKTPNEAGKLSPPISAVNNAFEKPLHDGIGGPSSTSRRPPSGINRPKSSRRPPSRTIRERLNVMQQESTSIKSQVPRVIVEGNPLSDDEEDKIVESAVFDQSTVDFSIIEDDKLLTGQQGKLVEQILSAQKEVEPSSETEVGNKEVGTVSQFQQLKAMIQEMTKSVLPLGQLIPSIHEDMETMHQEWTFWKKEADALEEEYNREKGASFPGVEKLKAELEHLDKLLADYEAKLSGAKAAVLKSEKDVSLVMLNFSKNR